MKVLGGWSVYSYYFRVRSTTELTTMTRLADAKGYMHIERRRVFHRGTAVNAAQTAAGRVTGGYL